MLAERPVDQCRLSTSVVVGTGEGNNMKCLATEPVIDSLR